MTRDAAIGTERLQVERIRTADTARHAAYFQFVEAVFGGDRAGSWASWRDRGGWTADYEVFALTASGQIASTIGRTRMHLVIEGRIVLGYQLGAVATRPDFRRQGLASRLMHQVLGALDTADQPVILLSNAAAVGFYPRFGFHPIPQRRSTAAAAIAPGQPAPRCDPALAADRARLAALCARAQPIRGNLSACNYGGVALCHLTCEPVTPFWLDQQDALVVVSQQGSGLVVHDVIAPQPFDLRPFAPSLITAPVTAVEFLFDPDDWWPGVTHAPMTDDEPVLFGRGRAVIAGPAQLPACAHT